MNLNLSYVRKDIYNLYKYNISYIYMIKRKENGKKPFI